MHDNTTTAPLPRSNPQSDLTSFQFGGRSQKNPFSKAQLRVPTIGLGFPVRLYFEVRKFDFSSAPHHLSLSCPSSLFHHHSSTIDHCPSPIAHRPSRHAWSGILSSSRRTHADISQLKGLWLANCPIIPGQSFDLSLPAVSPCSPLKSVPGLTVISATRLGTYKRLVLSPAQSLVLIMSQSPSSAGAMGIGNVLNIKAEPGAQQLQQGATPELQQQRPPQQLQQLQIDRQNSTHGSEQSRYSGPMNASYPSPTAMAATPLPPVPSAYMAPAPMVPHEMQQNLVAGIPPGGYQPAPGPQAPPKQFPCSTCGKPFARRSDLARHGRFAFALALVYCC